MVSKEKVKVGFLNFLWVVLNIIYKVISSPLVYIRLLVLISYIGGVYIWVGGAVGSTHSNSHYYIYINNI